MNSTMESTHLFEKLSIGLRENLIIVPIPSSLLKHNEPMLVATVESMAHPHLEANLQHRG